MQTLGKLVGKHYENIWGNCVETLGKTSDWGNNKEELWGKHGVNEHFRILYLIFCKKLKCLQGGITSVIPPILLCDVIALHQCV